LDELRLRQTLQAKASAIDLPPGAWERVQAALPAPPSARRLRRWLRGGLEAAFAAVLVAAMVVTVAHRKTGMPAGLVEHQVTLKQRPDTAADLPWDAFALRSRMAAKHSEALYQEMLRLMGASEFCLNPPVPGTNTEGGYLLYRGAESWPDLHLLSASRARSGGAYLLALRNAKGTYLLDGSGVREWPYSGPAASTEPGPIYVGDEVISVRWDAAAKTYAVWQGERPVYTLSAPSDGTPWRFGTLTAWEGHWVLEANDLVIIDGKPIGGYDAVFSWQLLNGKPFYLWQKGKTYGLSYGGEDRALPYDQILRGGELDPMGDGNTVTFLAQKDGHWQAVTITQP